MLNILKHFKYKWGLCFICIILFLMILEDVFDTEIMKMDLYGYQFISKYMIHSNITPIMKIITFLGSAIFYIPLIIILILLIKDKRITYSICINIVCITILNQLLKFLIQRPRPTKFRIIDASGYSFPSGHSMVSMAFYGFLIYLVYKYVSNNYLKSGIMLFLVLLILFIGISRIYLGVHYTSDVCGGFLISIAYLIIYIHYANSKHLKRS